MSQLLNLDILLSGNANFMTKNIINAVQSKFDGGNLWYKPKEGQSRKDQLYWYPSLNAGLPIVEKRDRIHQSVYMFHDMVHTVLFDPLPNSDKRTYIYGKMIGEVMSQLIADGMFALSVKDRFEPEYAYNRRFYIGMFEALAITQKVPLMELAHALAEYAIFDNRSPLWDLTDSSTKQMEDVDLFCCRYRSMFDADLWWNNNVWNSYPKDVKYDIPESLYYRSNTPIVLTNASEVIQHNRYLLDSLQTPENVAASGKELSKFFYLPDNGVRVYKHVTVNYKKRQEPRGLALIRKFLR